MSTLTLTTLIPTGAINADRRAHTPADIARRMTRTTLADELDRALAEAGVTVRDLVPRVNRGCVGDLADRMSGAYLPL